VYIKSLEKPHICRLENGKLQTATRCNALSYTATHCNIHCSTLQHTATHCNTHCNTLHNLLQHTRCNTGGLENAAKWQADKRETTYCHTLQHTLHHTATHYNTLQHAATHIATQEVLRMQLNGRLRNGKSLCCNTRR